MIRPQYIGRSEMLRRLQKHAFDPKVQMKVLGGEINLETHEGIFCVCPSETAREGLRSGTTEDEGDLGDQVVARMLARRSGVSVESPECPAASPPPSQSPGEHGDLGDQVVARMLQQRGKRAPQPNP